MSSLRVPGLGPIIGHTTHNTCCLWIRAGDPGDTGANLSSDRRTLGVIGLLDVTDATKPKVEKAYYFRLPREFDRTGVFWLGHDRDMGQHLDDGVLESEQEVLYKLEPDTEYTVRLGTYTLDDPLPDAEVLSDLDLSQRLPPIENMAKLLLSLPEDQCQVTFRTFPDPTKTAPALSFLLGSCRYPGLLWKIKEADRIFGPMLDHFKDENLVKDKKLGPPARFTLMMGDQIYADTLNRFIPIGLADTYQEFQDRYIQTFGAPNLKKLLKTAPTYMILDDHEIEDNWTQDRLKDKHKLFNFAIGAYMSYQWSHGPRTYGRLLYYTFESAGYPFFTLDMRTQRFKDEQEGLEDNHLLGRPSIDPSHPGQLQNFLVWLTKQQETKGNVPKFVVSSSVFAPNAMNERIDPVKSEKEIAEEDWLFKANKCRRENSDSWAAYPNTRLAILKHIVTEKIQNVIFLAGDIHCSNIAKLKFEGSPEAEKLCAYNVTSSALYWPFPFSDGDPNAYVHNSKASGQIDPFPIIGTGITMNYEAWGFTQEDNFCRIDIDKSQQTLKVRVFDREGNVVKTDGQNNLKLAKWD